MKRLTPTMTILGLVATLGLVGYGKQEKEATISSERIEVTLPTKGRNGKEIILPGEAAKIISLAPSTIETIKDLGRTGQLITVDTQSGVMMTDLKKSLQMDMMTIDAEKLTALRPQAVHTNNTNLTSSESAWKQMEDAGVTAVNIPTSTSIGAVKENIRFVADNLFEHEREQKLIKTVDQGIDEVTKIGKTTKRLKTVSFEMTVLSDVYSFDNGALLSEMIKTIEAKDVLTDERGWLPVIEEVAIAAKPEVVLTNVSYIKGLAEKVLAYKNWESVPIVQNKGAFEIDNMSSLLLNSHITRALRQIAKAAYPKEYKGLRDE